MMLSAHHRGEAWLVGTDNRGALPPVHAILADYQSTEYPADLTNVDFSALTSDTERGGDGGNGGFMRIMRFDTAMQMVNVETFSPAVDFTGLTYDDGSPPPANRGVLVSDYFPADGTQMDDRTASNFSFSFAGYVPAPNCN